MTGSPDLRSFIQRARDAGAPIIRIRRKVNPVHELSAVVKASERQGSPILIFENVDGAELPVVDGVLGSRTRIALALGMDLQSLTESYIERLAHPLPPEAVAEARAQEVTSTEDIDLGELSICVHAPLEAGRYITSGVCLVRDPASGTINTGIYRIMVKAKDRVTLSVGFGDDLARILTVARERGESIDVAIVVGGHPGIAIASQAKIPFGIDSLARILAFAPAHEARLLQTLRASRMAVQAVHIPTESAGLIACISLRPLSLITRCVSVSGRSRRTSSVPMPSIAPDARDRYDDPSPDHRANVASMPLPIPPSGAEVTPTAGTARW